ncbi:DUF4296 domain-containing protein [Flavihumibacter petaseus]|uniref:DUF4296 domain-containing protein n=1 Tax=Flavihumibacter petaseus NBRC 106054 TaxID=1220578 RepID=A0A0E9N8H5_9BACT|nr:DUF4296 domain-containing protein [Flavihumibacter petaseus]GAO45695.1 hypothetical protein FPE01S_08_00150 [Flavihumibacter petaseus NBRC 106054]
MKEWCIVLLALLVITGCGRQKEKSPALSRQQMVPIVYGLMLADEYSLQRSIKDSSLVVKEFRAEKYLQVFDLNKTDRKTFVASLQYYEGHPDQLKAIFDSVEAVATRRRYEKYAGEKPAPLKDRKPKTVPVK